MRKNAGFSAGVFSFFSKKFFTEALLLFTKSLYNYIILHEYTSCILTQIAAMFTVFISNSLEKLKDELYQLLRDNPLSSPLVPEIIVVQSQGMQKWLSLKLAEKFGSWASYKYMFPNNFLDTVFDAAPEKAASKSTDPFSREELSWLLMNELARIAADSPSEFPDISTYLRNDPDTLKRWQLATRIAYAFDQYLTFRPDYITAWEEGNVAPQEVQVIGDPAFLQNCSWQGILWRAIKKNISAKHRIERYRELISAIQKNESVIKNALPERAIVFGIPILPPLHVEVLSAISPVCPIYMFLLHPTISHGGIPISRKKKKALELENNNESHNTLLESFGNIGRGFLQELHDKKDIIFKCFYNEDDKEKRTLLCALQRNILHDDNTDFDYTAEEDQSIIIASCHSPMREVEVLRDYLLEILNVPDAPRLDDIIVMTPDIERYAPYIEAVFSSSDPIIPYTVSDRSLKGEYITIASFFSLLDIASSRFEASVVLDLLEKKPLQKCLKITDEDITAIKKWIEDTKIRWGFDASDKELLDLPATSENTWKTCLDRMFLGFAMPAEAFFDGIVPYDKIEGSSADLLGKISRFVHDLHDFTKIISKPHTLADWHAILSEWTARFLDASDESDSQYHLIDEALSKLSSVSASTGHTQPVHFRVIRAYLDSLLAENVSAHNFLSGKLTFCAMLPMRSIPFKVICLIGMNDGIFPRQDSSIAFDLMAKKPRPGDRSLRDEDRYLFLEALISAKEKLYISYTGQNIIDSSEIPPSVVVSELIDYLHERISPSHFNTIVIKHPLQPFSKRYFTGDGLFSYSLENFETAQKLVQSARRKIPVFINGKIAEPQVKDLSLTDLHSFLANPAKHFLQRGLGLRFRRDVPETEDDEPFSIDGLSGFQIKSMLLEDILGRRTANGLIENAFQTYRSMGLLPHGRVGMVAFEQLRHDTQNIAQKASVFLSEKPSSPVFLELKLPSLGILLSGSLPHVNSGYQTIIRPANMRAKDILNAWIYHLSLCALEEEHLPKKTVLVCSKSSNRKISDVIIFRPVERTDAIAHLSFLAHLSLSHTVALFHFIPECSLAYFIEYIEKKDESAAVKSAKREWFSDYGKTTSEIDDPYQKLCFGNMEEQELFGVRFQQNAIDIFTPIFEAIETEV